MVMSTKALKAIATVSIFALTIVSSLLPYKIRSSKRVLSVLNVLAGGVFLGAGLAHLLADSADEFAEYAESQHDHDHDDHDHDDHLQHGGDEDEPFPWAFVCCGIGFISTLAIEQVAHWLTHGKADSAAPCSSGQSDAHHGHSHGAKKTGDEDYLLADSINQDNSAPYSALSAPESINDVEGGGHHHHNHHHHHHDHSDEDHHGHSHVPLNTENQSFIIFIALWLALSYHSIVEGIVLGSSDQDTIKSIMVAILSHKALESFALGTGLIRSGASKMKFVLFCLAFACMTPIGIGIGSLVSNTWSGPVKAAITGFGAGTFLYVAVVEVLLPEFNKQQDTVFKILCLSAGFAGMSALALWV